MCVCVCVAGSVSCSAEESADRDSSTLVQGSIQNPQTLHKGKAARQSKLPAPQCSIATGTLPETVWLQSLAALGHLIYSFLSLISTRHFTYSYMTAVSYLQDMLTYGYIVAICHNCEIN